MFDVGMRTCNEESGVVSGQCVYGQPSMFEPVASNWRLHDFTVALLLPLAASRSQLSVGLLSALVSTARKKLAITTAKHQPVYVGV